MESDEIIVGVSVHSFGQRVDSLHVLSSRHGTGSARVGSDASLGDLAIAGIGRGTAVVNCGICSFAKTETSLDRREIHVLAWGLASDDLPVFDDTQVLIPILGEGAVIREILIGRTRGQRKLRAVDGLEVHASRRGTVALGVSCQSHSVWECPSINLASVPPSGLRAVGT